jgi:hypothetical protein
MTKDPPRRGALTPELVTLLQWTASVGAVTADALAALLDIGRASAHGRLAAAVHKRLLTRHRLLAQHPALYTVTSAGLRAAGIEELAACRVSAGTVLHTMVCAHAAVELQRRYPDQRVVGEPELRREERRAGAPVASAVMRPAGTRGSALHRPDLVIWPSGARPRGPVAVEVELTIKAPRRLEQICRAWARSRDVSGVLYLAPSDVERAVLRAIERSYAARRIAVLPLASLPLAAAPMTDPEKHPKRSVGCSRG